MAVRETVITDIEVDASQANKETAKNTKETKKNTDAKNKNQKASEKAQGALEGLADQLGVNNTLVQKSIGFLGGSTKALKLWQIALGATGIGLVVVALGAFISALRESQGAVDAITKRIDQARAVIGTFATRITEIFSGERNITKAFDGLGEAISNSVEAAGEAADETVRLREVNRAFQQQVGEINRELELQRQIRDDISRTDADREAAARRALELGAELEKTFRENGEENIRLLELQLEGQEGTVRGTELQNELADLRREKLENEAGAIGQIAEATNALNALETELAEKRAVRDEERRKQQIRDEGAQRAIAQETVTGTTIDTKSYKAREVNQVELNKLRELSAEKQKEINDKAEKDQEKIRANEQRRLEQKRAEDFAYADLALNLARGVGDLIFEDDKKGAIASAIINTAQSVTRTSAQLGFPLAIPFIAVALASGLAQINAIRSTNKGSGGSVRTTDARASPSRATVQPVEPIRAPQFAPNTSLSQVGTDLETAVARSRPVLVTEQLDAVGQRVEATEQAATL